MNVLNAFEKLSTIPFCSNETKKTIFNSVLSNEARESFLNGDQLELREILSHDKYCRFADTVDVVSL